MSCNCKYKEYNCVNITGTVAYDSASTSLVITPTTAVTTIVNESRVCLRVTNNVPVANITAPVTITLGGANVPVYDRYGNIVYGASLHPNVIIKAYYGTNGSGGTAHLQIINQPFIRS